MFTETVMWAAVIVGVMAMASAFGFFLLRRRRDRLRERFGPEYERTVAAAGERRAAEREQRVRRTRSGPLDIQPLDPGSRRAYADRWAAVQERFVNEPSPAVCEADLLVRAVMAKRGYATEDFAQQASELSLRHSRILEHYRQAHEISGRATSGWVSIQELRQAMTHYHALFDALLGGDQRPARAGAAARSPLTHAHGTAGPRR
ncbi:LPXTG cell wall anchor domain-containing protein [Nonomuraea sp. GTA35]|uniref:LPXTG cell wall anchor domain-containing protein n=1 Tax=Nonomuraea sp. GTA35 TaxID=1676746 RepID=UPI0035C21FAE